MQVGSIQEACEQFPKADVLINFARRVLLLLLPWGFQISPGTMRAARAAAAVCGGRLRASWCGQTCWPAAAAACQRRVNPYPALCPAALVPQLPLRL